MQRRKTAAELIKYFDGDGDGRIDLQEFRDGMRELVKVRGLGGYCFGVLLFVHAQAHSTASARAVLQQAEGKSVLKKIDLMFSETSTEAKSAAGAKTKDSATASSKKKGSKGPAETVDEADVPMTASGYILSFRIVDGWLPPCTSDP